MSTARAAWLDGEFHRGDTSLFDAFDPALLLGDGLFETLAISHDPAPWLSQHERRLRRSAGRLGFELGEAPAWEPLLHELLRRAELPAGRARITLLGPACRPRLLATVAPLPADLAERRRDGISLWSSSFRIGGDDPTAGHKLISRAFYLAAEREAQARGADDALLLGEQGEIRECTRWNVFVQHGQEAVGRWLTPVSTGAILPGIARARVLQRLAELGEPGRECVIPQREIRPETTLFVTNSVYGVVPVRSLDGKPLLPPKGLDRLGESFLS